MAVLPFQRFLLELRASGARSHNQHLSPNEWMKLASKQFQALRPQAQAELAARAQATPAGPAPVKRSKLPLDIQAYAQALRLPLKQVEQMYPNTAPFRPPLFRIKVVARRLGAALPTRMELRRQFLMHRTALRDVEKMAAMRKEASSFTRTPEYRKAVSDLKRQLMERGIDKAALTRSKPKGLTKMPHASKAAAAQLAKIANIMKKAVDAGKREKRGAAKVKKQDKTVSSKTIPKGTE